MISTKRLAVLTAFIIVLVLLVLGRTLQLQVAPSEPAAEFMDKAIEKQDVTMLQAPPRGTIFDSDGNVMAVPAPALRPAKPAATLLARETRPNAPARVPLRLRQHRCQAHARRANYEPATLRYALRHLRCHPGSFHPAWGEALSGLRRTIPAYA